MANRKKKKNRKHINRRKRAEKQTLQVETQEPKVQGFLTRRTLVCALAFIACIAFGLLFERWSGYFIVSVLRLLSIGGSVFIIGVLFYRNYTEKTVKILYWTVFVSSILSLYLITWQGWTLCEFLMLTVLTLYTCIVYMRENRKGTKKFLKTSRYRKITLNSFLPISVLLVLRAYVLFLQFSKYTYIKPLAVFGLGTGVGAALALLFIVWLCFSGYRYLERKGGENHSTAHTAILILFTCIVFGWFLVAIPNQTVVLEQKVTECEIWDKHVRSRKGRVRYEICIEVKGSRYFLDVNSDVFENYSIGDTVTVEFSKGLFGLEYLYIPQD